MVRSVRTEGRQSRSFAPLSEDSIARTFTRKHGPTLRYDHDRGKWFEWSGNHWIEVRDNRVFHYARELAREISGGQKHICRASVIAGIERMLRADRRHAVTSESWDHNRWLLGTPAGTIDLRTGKLRRAQAADGITKITGCSPKNGSPQRWIKFLQESTGGDGETMQYLQRIAGYCLTGDTSEHALFFLFGPGGNGKSVVLNLLTHIVGDYAVNAPMEMFTKSKFAGHPTELAMLAGARMVVASETEEGVAWADARIKSLTGGDRITARFMRQDFFSFMPQFKLLFAGNHQPLVHSVDAALRRRFNMLSFIHQPESPDRRLEDKLKAEAPQILTWAVDGCLQWQKVGLAPPEVVSTATAEYFDEQDTLGQWLAERCDVGPRYSEVPSQLFASWSEFVRPLGDEPGSMVLFTGRLKRAGMRRVKVGGVRFYQGLRLKGQVREGQDGSGLDS